VGVIVVGAAVSVGVLAAPAWAHVQVEADPGSPGATDATLKIMAAGESGTAGTSKLEVVADPAIPADQVTLVSGPSGWTLTPGAAGGFTLAGPALAKGDDANVSVKVKQLPNAPQVTFKVVQTYSDGEVVRWIELAGADGKEPDNPAPIVKLTPGAVSSISPKPANDEDAKPAAAAANGGNLARTGAADRALALAAGLLILVGGWGIALGAGRRKQLGILG
jgi:uncharacterized protein YcnI